MMWIQAKRVFRSGLVSFWRNGVVSLSSVLMMILTLFVISSIVFSTALLQSALDDIKSKVDVNVYFIPSATEDEVLIAKSAIEKLGEVQYVEYVSREQALEEFRADHAGDEDTLTALDELSENPLGAALNVKAREPSQFKAVSDFLAKDYPEGASIVEKVNYNENQVAIERLSAMIAAGKKLGTALTAIFIIISVIITFNTVRLAIYIARDEIHVMRLVGATNSYIRGPFVVIGALYGLVSALITLIMLWPITYWLGPFTDQFFAGTSVFEYYVEDFALMFLILVGAGIVIGATSSLLAVRRYLR
jgi:cell division transport system permease protein